MIKIVPISSFAFDLDEEEELIFLLVIFLLAALSSAFNLFFSVIQFAFSFFSEFSISLFLCGGPVISVAAPRWVAAAFF
jgi:hypothetical protein